MFVNPLQDVHFQFLVRKHDVSFCVCHFKKRAREMSQEGKAHLMGGGKGGFLWAALYKWQSVQLPLLK